MNISERFGKLKKWARTAVFATTVASGILTGSPAQAKDPRLPDYSEAPTPQDVIAQRQDALQENFSDPAKPGTVYIRPLGHRFPMERYGLIMLGPSEDFRSYREPSVRAEIYDTHKKALTAIVKYAASYANQDNYQLADGTSPKPTVAMSGEDLSAFIDSVGQINNMDAPLWSRTRNYMTVLRGLEYFPEGSAVRTTLSAAVANSASFDQQLFKKLSIENPDFTGPVSYKAARIWKWKNNTLKTVKSAKGDYYPVYGETRNRILIQHDTKAAPYMFDTISALATNQLYQSTAHAIAPSELIAPTNVLKQKMAEVSANYNNENNPGSLLQMMVLINTSAEARKMVNPKGVHNIVIEDTSRTMQRTWSEFCVPNANTDNVRQNANLGKVYEQLEFLKNSIDVNVEHPGFAINQPKAQQASPILGKIEPKGALFGHLQSLAMQQQPPQSPSLG